MLSLEGNIGAGKSTLLSKLEKTKFSKDHIVMYEPVDEWLNVRPDGPNSMSLFQKYYSDKRRHGFLFQMYALQTRLTHLLQVIENNPDKIIICERTHLTDAEIFAKMLAQDNIMDASEYFVYKEWYNHCNKLLNGALKGVIYLRTSVPVCMTRIAKRNRGGEDNISVGYINTLHKLHDEWLLNHNNLQICVVDGDVDEEQVDIHQVTQFINSLAI